MYVCPNTKTRRFISCPECYDLLLKTLSSWKLPDITDDEFHALLEKFSYLKFDEFVSDQVLTDGGSTLRVGTFYDNVLHKVKSRSEDVIGTEAEAVLMAVMNLKSDTRATIFNDNQPLMSILQNYRVKNRKYEDIYKLIKALEKRKNLDLIYQYSRMPITH